MTGGTLNTGTQANTAIVSGSRSVGALQNEGTSAMTTIKKMTACLFASVTALAFFGGPAAAFTIVKVKNGPWKDAVNWDPKKLPVFDMDAIIRADTSIGEDFVAVAKTVALESNLVIGEKGTLSVGIRTSNGLEYSNLKIGTVDANATMTVSGKAAVLRVGQGAGSTDNANCLFSICLGALNAGRSVVSTGRLDVTNGGAVLFDVFAPYKFTSVLTAYKGSALNISGAVSSPKCNTWVNELRTTVCERWPGSARTPPAGCASCA